MVADRWQMAIVEAGAEAAEAVDSEKDLTLNITDR